MPEQREYLRHDLTALYAFIDSIVEGLASRRSSAAYSPAAIEFLKFVSDLAASTKEHLASWSVTDDEDFEDKRGELGTIRADWRELHRFIKPVLDADTLQAPSAVVDGIVRRFRELPGSEGTKFALFHTSEFNYVQVRTADLNRIATKFKKIIRGAPEFPPDLGLIGIPYSQGRTAFGNCLVAHEMGHYKYRGMPLEHILRQRADLAFKSLPANPGQTQDDDKRDATIKQLTLWAEEIFCDLFGVMLIGPCYTYAYVEAYDLSGILGPSGNLSEERFLEGLRFYGTYPSHIFRLQQQSLLLRGLPWWNHLERSPSRFSVLLKAIQGISMETHLRENQSKSVLLRLLEVILPEIKESTGNVFDGVDDGFVSFSELNPVVQSYLAAGVVPSTLNVRTGDGPGDLTTVIPSPQVLLNAGIEFYLTRTNDLIRSIRGEDEHLFDRRLHWIRRVEEWIAKAIEDESLEKEEVCVHPVENGNPEAPQA